MVVSVFGVGQPTIAESWDVATCFCHVCNAIYHYLVRLCLRCCCSVCCPQIIGSIGCHGPWLDKEELELTLEHESPTISPRSNAVNMKTFATPSWQVRCWDTYSFELHIKHFGPIWDPLLISMQWVPSDNQPLTTQPLPLQVANGDWCTVDKDTA